MIVLNNGNPKTVILNGLKIKFNKGESIQPDNDSVILFVKRHPALSIVSKEEDAALPSNENTKSELPDPEVTESSESKKRKKKRKDR